MGESRLSPKSYHRILRASNRDGFLSQSLASHGGRSLSACARFREEGMALHAMLWLFGPLLTQVRIPHRGLSPCYMTSSWVPFCKRAEAPASEALARLGTKVLNLYTAYGNCCLSLSGEDGGLYQSTGVCEPHE